VPERPQPRLTGDPIIDGNTRRAAAPVQDRVLWDYRIAASALRAGQPDEAKLRLDTALPLIGGILANDADAKKARSLFAAEQAVLQARQGELNNRVALFKALGG
jgi:hypothetical protein